MYYGPQDTKKMSNRCKGKQQNKFQALEIWNTQIKASEATPLVFRRIRGDMTEIYKIINVYDPKVATQLIQLNKNKSTRGHSTKKEVIMPTGTYDEII